jgi:ammonia channel protein AmtB
MSTAKVFAEQVSADALLTSFFYIFSTLGVLMATVAVIIFDAGLVKEKNIVDTIIQKVVAAFIGGMSFMLVGYGIWNLQIYQALGIEHPLSLAISNWGLFGHNMNVIAPHLDPATAPEADLFQIFSIFFFTFAALTAAFIHSAGLERLKPAACYIMAAFVGGLVAPILYYLTYSSASFLTNNGMHDFVGIYSVYIFCGVWSVVMSWRLGKRVEKDHAPNFVLVTIGALLLIVAIPALVIGNGFAVPGKGYFGITMNDSGLGMIFINIFMSLGTGAISGALIAYRKKKPSYVFLGAIAGYISGTALFDIALPWETIVVAFFAPFIVLYSTALLEKMGIDDPKIGPLTLGPGIYGALAAGVIGNGLATGGFFGIKSGEYAYQHAQMSLGMQALGVVLIVVGTAILAFIVLFILEHTVGIRISAAEEKAGLDETYWSHGIHAHAGASAYQPGHVPAAYSESAGD